MRRLLRIAFAFAVLLLGLVAAVLIAARTRPVREYVNRVVIGALAEETDADVRIGAVEGSLVHTLVLRDVRLIVGRRTVVRVPRLELAYALLPLLRGELRLDRLAVTGPRVRAVRTARGWRLPHLTGGSGRSRPPALAVVVERLTVERGRVAVALRDAEPPRRFAATALALDASARVGRHRRTLDVRSLAFVPRGIDLSPVRVAAAIAEEADGA